MLSRNAKRRVFRILSLYKFTKGMCSFSDVGSFQALRKLPWSYRRNFQKPIGAFLIYDRMSYRMNTDAFGNDFFAETKRLYIIGSGEKISRHHKNICLTKKRRNEFF